MPTHDGLAARQVPASKSENQTASLRGNLSIVVVMGVSGCGKSTIASMLAHRLNWIYEDGDWFHPQSNVRKMHVGEPLTDEDRWPWLHGIAAWIDATRRVGNHGTVACSALKRAYRDILVGERRDVRIVYLKGERDLIARRLAARDGHFMPPSLLNSHFAALEEPQPDEHPTLSRSFRIRVRSWRRSSSGLAKTQARLRRKSPPRDKHPVARTKRRRR